MTLFHLMAVVGLGFSALALGCGAPSDGDVPDALDMAVPDQPLVGAIGANGMSPLDFWNPSVQSALRDLGGRALLGARDDDASDDDASDDGARGDLAATSLRDSAVGRRVLDYVVRCALPRGTTVSGAGGLPLRGSFGLAEAWATRGLNTTEQRWVTACLLQHLNGLGVHVGIMLEGHNPGLHSTSGEDASDYTVRDTTMFGNVFTSGYIKAWACTDLDLRRSCGLDLSLLTVVRLCGLAPLCGVAFLGSCRASCADDASGGPTCRTPVCGTTYPEAIRSTIQDTNLISLYPGCDLL